MPITTEDIAKRLGVSSRSVRYALNGGNGVSAATREKVLQLASEMGYDRQANHEARALIARRYGKRVRSYMIAVVACRVAEGSVRDAPYFLPLFSGMEEEACDRDLGIVLTLWNNERRNLGRSVTQGIVDGIIMLSAFDELERTVATTGLPVLDLFHPNPHVPSIALDDRSGSRLATDHLLDLGHYNIAYLGQRPIFHNQQQRLAGFHEALGARGISARDELYELTLNHPDLENGFDGMKRLMARTTGFSALVCYNDTIAMGAVRALQASGLRVPEDISVVGFDDVCRDYGFQPELTSISYDRREMGRLAVRMLCGLIDRAESGIEVTEIDKAIIPVRLVARASTLRLQSRI